eukprot:gnl/MRDRNA2_/MRDRNA2_133874_c0_seq1.p1 gnl/MRDRNA2_/MRDRNA2_133874_c0~~gnl/MRDRNA2_/MRDRNA2_133874_c0_seq1.p1  ORF type:complete len:198 (+),score=25.49 gnl/MRDRNA2_/MRDRNA2_133874_c0_seq1:188-781(+)
MQACTFKSVTCARGLVRTVSLPNAVAAHDGDLQPDIERSLTAGAPSPSSPPGFPYRWQPAPPAVWSIVQTRAGAVNHHRRMGFNFRTGAKIQVQFDVDSNGITLGEVHSQPMQREQCACACDALKLIRRNAAPVMTQRQINESCLRMEEISQREKAYVVVRKVDPVMKRAGLPEPVRQLVGSYTGLPLGTVSIAGVQ